MSGLFMVAECPFNLSGKSPALAFDRGRFIHGLYVPRLAAGQSRGNAGATLALDAADRGAAVAKAHPVNERRKNGSDGNSYKKFGHGIT